MQLHIIHLPERTDRLALLQHELISQGITEYHIWPGIKDELQPCNGISKAHKQIVRWAKDSGLEEVTIAEDDIHFTAPGAWNHYNTNKPHDFDIYLGSVYVLHEIESTTIREFTGLTLYTIKRKFFDTFLNLPEVGNIDVNLYQKGDYKLCYPFAAIQHETYSDNSRTTMSYLPYMKGKKLFGTDTIELEDSQVNLYINFFLHPNPARHQELVHCISTNLNNPAIDRIYVFCEEAAVAELLTMNHQEKLYIIQHEGRPTYSEIFEAVNIRTGDRELNIIANTDIYFDESIELVHRLDKYTCYALSRWESNYPLMQIQSRGDSQDVWAFRGKIKQLGFSNFTLGVLGCDNRIAHELNEVGYQVLNPSLSIRTWHLHESGIRANNYYEVTIPRPYLSIKPHAL